MDVYQWTREHVQHRLEQAFKLLGAEIGDREKKMHEEMVAYVDQQSAMLRRLIEIGDRKLGEQIDKQAKTIEAQNHRLKSVEAMFAQPGKEASAVDRAGRYS